MSLQFPTDASSWTHELATRLVAKRWRLVTAESCTGGLLACLCTSLSGSSEWFERGFVTYANAAKSENLGVSPELLAKHGAVSEAVAREMASGALRASHAQIAVAITGIAGPSGGSPDKPVGLVWFGFALGHDTRCESIVFPGNREQIRHAAAQHALQRLITLCT